MNINDYKDGTGNVEVSENLVSDLIGGINGVVESGSNANGNLVKFADGTLIFYTIRTLSTFGQGGQINFPTPTPFISVTNGFATFATTDSYRMNYYEAGSSVSSISFLVSQLGSSTPAPNSTSVTAVVFAIGRWK